MNYSAPSPPLKAAGLWLVALLKFCGHLVVIKVRAVLS